MNFWFLIFGATIALVGMVFHGFVGQKKYMGNINQGELENLTKSLSLVSWHMFTIFLLVSAISLIFVAFFPVYKIAVYPLILANLLGALLFVLLGIGKHKVLLVLPGAYLMSFTALFGFLGVYL
tara:strand:- start:1579 stop:1950 length:372 start_codon:yes stop_codon:yes gene_type:complete